MPIAMLAGPRREPRCRGQHCQMLEVQDLALAEFTRLSYLTVSKSWVVVETPRNRTEIDRNRFVPVCGQAFWAWLRPVLGPTWVPNRRLRPDP